MAGVGSNLPLVDGLGHADREREQPGVQMNPGGRSLRESPGASGVNDVESDSEAGCLERSQVARAWGCVADISVGKRATCAPLRLRGSAVELVLMVGEDILVQHDGSKALMAYLEKDVRRGGNPILLSDWDACEDAARTRDEGVRQPAKVQVRLRQAQNCRIGATPDDFGPLVPPSMWTQPPRETPRRQRVCEF